MTYAYRIGKTMMVHAYGFWARTVGQDAAHTDDHPLKNGAPVTDEATFLAEHVGRALGFDPVAATFVFRFTPALNRNEVVQVWVQLPITFQVQ